MNYLFQGRVAYTLGLLLALCLVAAPTFARKNGGRAQDATRHSEDAARVFNEIMDASDHAIPKELVDKAQAIAVFPGVVKAAFIVGGREGKGVISRRTDAGWSAPAFFNLKGGSFGAQIGADKTDYVLLIMNEKGLNKLQEDKLELGGDVGVAAGPVGREASAATDAQLGAEILTYSRSKGAFIGASLKGTVITPDNDLNEAFYGIKAKEVLNGGVNGAPYTVLIYPQTLSRY
ncbi:MAG: lipid-binding SYLF domain-containing protein [Pyrinomonadaceae bacterium]|nr:lipid-binding SYLF domain-containing protein [Pyrinomonadaceae bacterium]